MIRRLGSLLLRTRRARFNLPVAFEHGYMGSNFMPFRSVPERMKDTIPAYFTDETLSTEEVMALMTPDDHKRLEIIKVELEYLYMTGETVPNPDSMTDSDWISCLNRPIHKRMRFYEYLLGQQQQEQGEIDNTSKVSSVPGLSPAEVARLNGAMYHGQKLVVDLGYENLADKIIYKLVADVGNIMKTNAQLESPFHLMLTGLSLGSFQERYLKEAYGGSLDHLPLSTFSGPLSEVIPRKKIVVITQDAKHSLEEWDREAIYVLPGIYYGTRTEGDSNKMVYKQAVREHLRTGHIPIKKYLGFKLGANRMSLTTQMKILSKFYASGSWSEALQILCGNTRSRAPNDQLLLKLMKTLSTSKTKNTV